MKIFNEDGYLKAEYINPNYRGLVGWPDKDEYVILGLCGEDILYKTPEGQSGVGKHFNMVEIPAFTPQDIPVGELCWVKGKDDWYRVALKSISRVLGSGLGEDKFYFEDGTYYYSCVPDLIAGTPEQAEERKNWAEGGE